MQASYTSSIVRKQACMKFYGTQSEAVFESSAQLADSIESHARTGCSIAATKWQRMEQI